MLTEAKPSKLDNKLDTLVNQTVRTQAIPSINRTLSAPPFTEFDPKKLIKKIVVMEGSLDDLKKKERTEKPIRKVFPYYDELVQLGVNPEVIEKTFYEASEEMPYDRDILRNPSQLNIPRNFSGLFYNPVASVSNVILTLDLLGAPQPREVKDPKVKSIAREIIRKYTIETSLRKIIEETGLDFEDPKFDHVKTRIKQDLDVEHTQFFFFGAQVLGVLDGQTVYACAFRAGADLDEGIALLLGQPVLETTLADLRTNPIDAHKIMQGRKKSNKEILIRLNEKTGLDLSSDDVSMGNEKYKYLLSLYLNSQIPLVAIDLIS